MEQDPFKEYLRQTEVSQRDKGNAWNTAIGLQAVDGLKPSRYLVEADKVSLPIAKLLSEKAFSFSATLDYDLRPEKADIGQAKADIGQAKADIGQAKADIGSEKADRGWLDEYENLLLSCSAKTIAHVRKMYQAFGKNIIFGRSDVQKVTGLKHTRASELLNILSEAAVILSVEGFGKGKYRFR